MNLLIYVVCIVFCRVNQLIFDFSFQVEKHQTTEAKIRRSTRHGFLHSTKPLVTDGNSPSEICEYMPLLLSSTQVSPQHSNQLLHTSCLKSVGISLTARIFEKTALLDDSSVWLHFRVHRGNLGSF